MERFAPKSPDLNGATARGSRAITSELANLGRPADLEQNVERKTTQERAPCTPETSLYALLVHLKRCMLLK